MKFSVLGPLEISYDADEISSDAGRLELPGARQQIVVAMLLLSANRPVTMDRLLEAVYGEDLPPTARSQVQISISTLRRLFASCGQDSVITTRAGGYAIRVGDGELDSERFEELIATARESSRAGELDLAVAGYRDALRLWRGPALEGIDSEPIRAAASRLDELRVSADEDRIALELQLGRHHELVGELTELVKEYPLREALRAHLMLALYRCDRVAEALQTYRETRRTMIDELGIEPGERLQQMERSMLVSDPAMDPPSGPATVQPHLRRVPNLLPADIADFTGREDQIARIERHLVGVGEQARLAVPVAVVVGRGGIGKTTLAVHASHAVSEYFTDGQLFADLHGTSGHPVSPGNVLERFIRAFDVPGAQIPDSVDERAEMYRNLLADRQMLVLLDDAASESQLRPLLPGSPTAGVIVTSRRRLTGIAGGLRVELDVFAAENSLDLLARIVGAGRLRGHADAAGAVAAHCGHLPLALRIAGARLAARPHWSIQHLADRLSDEVNRLDELRHGDMGVRPSISITYDSVSEQARKLFRRLALLDTPVFSGWLAPALLDMSLTAAEDLLDELVNAQLIEVTTSGFGLDSQYRFHDLVHVFARERLAAEEQISDRRGALERALGALLYLTEEARSRYYGGSYAEFQSHAVRWALPERLMRALIEDPLSWYDRERATLVAGVRQAAQSGFVELCWSLASSAVPLFESRVYLNDWRESHDIALKAVRKARHVRGEAVMLYHIGSLHITQLQVNHAFRELSAAVRLFEEVGDDHGVAHATFLMAHADRLSGRLDDAYRGYQRALSIFRRADDDVATASVLLGLAQVNLEREETDSLMELLSEALRLCQATPYPRLEAQILHRLGEAYLLTAEIDHAAEAFEHVLVITRGIGDTIGVAYALQGLGVARLRRSVFDQARDALNDAVELSDRVGEHMARARSLLGLSELELATGDAGKAARLGQLAVDVFDHLKAPLYQARALAMVSEAQRVLGDTKAAAASTEAAAALRKGIAVEQP